MQAWTNHEGGCQRYGRRSYRYEKCQNNQEVPRDGSHRHVRVTIEINNTVVDERFSITLLNLQMRKPCRAGTADSGESEIYNCERGSDSNSTPRKSNVAL